MFLEIRVPPRPGPVCRDPVACHRMAFITVLPVVGLRNTGDTNRRTTRQLENRGTVNPFHPIRSLWFPLLFPVLLLGFLPTLHSLEAQPEPAQPGSPTRIRPSEAVAQAVSRMAQLRDLLAEIRRERCAAEEARQAWQREKASLEDEIVALDQRHAALTVQLEERTRTVNEAAAKKEQAALELDRLRTHYEQGLRREYGTALQWLLRYTERSLPVDRPARVDAVQRAIRRGQQETTALSRLAGDQFGFVFKALSRSRTFEAHQATIRESDGKERVVDALRIGPVQVLSLTPDDQEIRGIRFDDTTGQPVWTAPQADPALARTLRRALEIARRRRTPELLELPIPITPAPPATPPPSRTGKEESREGQR